MTELELVKAQLLFQEIFSSRNNFDYLMNLSVNLLKKSHFTNSLPCSSFQYSSNPPELPTPTKISIPNQPWGKFSKGAMKLSIEDPKKVKVVNPSPHSTLCSPKPKPSSVLGTPNPQSQPAHFLTIILLLRTHLKMWINHVISVTPHTPLTV